MTMVMPVIFASAILMFPQKIFLTIGSAFLGLAITELNYHPHEPTGSELLISTNADDYEFIELRNLGSTTINLSGAKFITGITYTFPTQTLTAGSRTVLVKNPAAVTARYGSGLNVSGTFGGQLSNGGEELHLTDSNNATILRFTYQDNADWPGRADGSRPRGPPRARLTAGRRTAARRCGGGAARA